MLEKETFKGSRGMRRNEQEWRTLLARYESSGLTARAFCQREAISLASLYRWRGLLGVARVQHGIDAAPARFVDLGTLRAKMDGRAQVEITLDLGGGLMLHLARG